VYRGYHEFSFAHATMSSRLPTILGKAIDNAIITLNSVSSEERVVDLSGNAKAIAKYFQGRI